MNGSGEGQITKTEFMKMVAQFLEDRTKLDDELVLAINTEKVSEKSIKSSLVPFVNHKLFKRILTGEMGQEELKAVHKIVKIKVLSDQKQQRNLKIFGFFLAIPILFVMGSVAIEEPEINTVLGLLLSLPVAAVAPLASYVFCALLFGKTKKQFKAAIETGYPLQVTEFTV